MTRSPLLPIFLIVLVDVLGLTIIIPLLPFYAEHFGASPFQVGLLISIYALCQLIAGPIMGRISDRTGRKPLLMLSQAGTLAGFIILILSNSLWMVYLSRVIDGITAGNLSLAQAYISDVTAPEERTRAFGLIGISFGIGFVIGPAISAFLSQYGYAYPIAAAAALSASSIIATYTLLPGGPVHAHDPNSPAPLQGLAAFTHFFKRRGLAFALLQYFLYTLAFALFTSGFALFAERRYTFHGHPFGPREVGYVLTYVGIIGIIIPGGLTGRAVRLLGDRMVVTFGLLSLFVGYCWMGFAYTVTALMIATTISSFGGGFLRAVLTSMVSRRAGRSEQGAVLGVNQSLLSVAQIVGPMIAGALIGRGLLTTWAIVAGCLAAAGLMINRDPDEKTDLLKLEETKAIT